MKNFTLILILATLSMLTALSVDIYLPTVSQISQSFKTSPEMVGLSLSLFLFSYAFGQLMFGPISDKLGRLKVLKIGLGLYIFSSLVCAVSATLEIFYLGRFFQGASACCGPITAFAMVGDLFERERAVKVNAYIDVITALAPMIAPVLGSLIAVRYGWRGNFVFLIATAFSLLVISPQLLLETKKPETAALSLGSIFNEYKTMLRHPDFRRYMIFNALSFTALMTIISLSPLVFMTTFKLGAVMFSKLFAANSFMLVVGGFLASKLSIGLDRSIRLGFILIVLSGVGILAYCLLGATLSVAPILVLSMLATVGIAVVLPNSTAGSLAIFKKTTGASSALVGFGRFAAGGIASAILTSLSSEIGAPLALAVGTASCGICGVLYFNRKNIADTEDCVKVAV